MTVFPLDGVEGRRYGAQDEQVDQPDSLARAAVDPPPETFDVDFDVGAIRAFSLLGGHLGPSPS